MQSPNQDIYHQDQPPAFARRRRRWLSLSRPPSAPPSPAASTASGAALRTDPPPRLDRERRRRRRQEHTPHVARINRLIWASVASIAVLYLLTLAGVEAWARRHPRPAAAKAPAETPKTVPAPQPSVAGSVTLADRIVHWKKGLRALADISFQLAKGDLGASQAALENVLVEVPDLTRARLELALIMERQARYAEARDMLTEVLDNDPESLPARIALARIYLALNEPASALAMARWVIEADPYSSPAHQLAADALLNQDLAEEALVHLKKLASLNRDDLSLQNNLGLAYLKTGDYRSALQVFQEVLRLEEGNSVAHYHLAVTYAGQGQATQAVEVLNKAAQRFGTAFVGTWTQGADFDPIRQDPAFQRLLNEGPAPVPTGVTNQAAQ